MSLEIVNILQKYLRHQFICQVSGYEIKIRNIQEKEFQDYKYSRATFRRHQSELV